MSGPWRLCLAGAGHVGGGLLTLLAERGTELAERYGADVRVCGVAELGGAVVDPEGLDVSRVRKALAAGEPLGRVPGVGRPGMTPLALLHASRADVLLEATPVDLATAEPALTTVRTALRQGTHVVLANKAPLALAYGDLAALSDLTGERDGTARRPRLRFSATVAGALPVVNLGRRDLAGCRITRIEGVFNGTSHGILRAMEAGSTFDEALADAQRRGIAETDPSLDVDGHDAACKLAITANAVLDQRCTVADVATTGIRGVTVSQVRAAQRDGRRVLLLCTAEPGQGGFRLSVRPTPVALEHPLARLGPDEMGVVYHTDWVDRLSAASLEPGPEPASAAMLRDLIDIVRSETCHST
jgi:homoserine dehydrogenase